MSFQFESSIFLQTRIYQRNNCVYIVKKNDKLSFGVKNDQFIEISEKKVT